MTVEKELRTAIRDDVQDQVSHFMGRLRATFDVDAYPRVDDGAVFDEELRRLEKEFERLKLLFHDYLLASWSEEVSDELDRPTSG